jgi:cytoskeleton protein RodZ
MKELTSIQIEQLQQIGNYLQQVREVQAVSLEKVAQETYIPLRLLEAIEVGAGSRLPEPVYIKGFIRRYADALGLDGQEIADAFDLEPSPASPVPVDARAATAEPISPSLVSSHIQPHEKTGRAKSPILVYALSGIAAVGVVGAIALGIANSWQSNSAQLTKAPVVATQNSTLTPPAPAATSGNVSPNPNSAKSSSPPAADATTQAPTLPNPAKPATGAPLQVDISLTDRSWMQVVADGKTIFEDTLVKGEQRTWTAKNNLLIRAGNAGAVVASLNQGQAKPLGRLGAVVDAKFSRSDDSSKPNSARQ